MNASEGMRLADRRIVLIALAAVVAALWVAPLASSFWTDETVTAWIVRPDLGETWRLAEAYQAPPPLTFAVFWASAELFGSSEVAMRLPSFLALALAVFVVARIGRRLYGREAGWWSGAIFCLTGTAGFLATDARPYGIATLALVASTFFLVRWLDDGRWTDGALWAACTALVFHTAYIYAPALAGQVWFILARQRRGRHLSWATIGFALATTVVLVAPIVPFVLEVLARNDELAMRSHPTAALVMRVIPAAMFGGIFVGVLLARAEGGRLRFESPAASPGTVGLVLSWLVAPPLFLSLLSALLDVGLYTDRYLACTAPASALLIGWLLTGLHPATGRRLVVVAMAVASILAVGTIAHTSDNGTREDWRYAMDLASHELDEGGNLLMDARLIEAANIAWLRDEERASYTMAPLAMYPAGTQAIPMPSLLNEETRPYLDELMPDLLASDRNILVSRFGEVRDVLQGRFEAAGYTTTVTTTHGIQVLVFERVS